jgi:hypothetical protein
MPTPAPRQQLGILEAMILIAGIALGLWEISRTKHLRK